MSVSTLISSMLVLALTVPGLAAQEVPSLSDAEIAHVAVTANTIDVHMAQLATERSRHDEVLAFANTMVRDHTAVNERAAALAARLGVEPHPNAVSRSLEDDARATRTSLATLDGSAFDRAYMEREVAYHQAVLDALDSLLIPQTRNGELRRLLEEVRPAIATHLDHARHIAASIGDAK